MLFKMANYAPKMESKMLEGALKIAGLCSKMLDKF